MKETILVSAAFWNMGETSLAIEIAKSIKNSYNVVFFSFGGLYEYVVKEEKFKIINLNPRIDQAKTTHLYEIDRCEKFGSYFSSDEVRRQVIAELDLFKKIKPVGIITALNFSTYISARIAKVPLFSIGHSTWLCESATRKGKVNIFNSDYKMLSILQIYLTKLMAMIYIKCILRPYNQVMKSYGLKKFNSYEDWWAGDYTIMTEPQGFVDDLKLHRDQFYTGAIFADLYGEVPFDINSIKEINKGKKIIYFGMGSSGILDVIQYVMEELAQLDEYIIITPMKQKIGEIGMQIPSNFIVTDWIPTKEVLPFFDAAVIHGGLGTVFSTIDAEIPFISIPLHAEQELNADYCCRKGICLKIKPFKTSIKKKIKLYLDLLTHEESYKKNVMGYAKEIRSKNRLSELGEYIEKSITKYKGDVIQ